MAVISRRALARYTVDELTAGSSAKLVAAQLASVLVATKRQSQTQQLLDDIRYELEERGLSASARAVVAEKLDSALRQELISFIKKSAGVKTVNLDEVIDQSVIGGVRIETARYAWDQTIKRRLTDIKEAF